MQLKQYNLHNIMNFTIDNDLPFPSRFINTFDAEYMSFETELQQSQSDLTIAFGKFSPDLKDTLILDNKIYIKENYIYGEDSYKAAKWRFDLRGFDKGDISLRIDCNVAASLIVSGYLIDPLLHYKLTELGYTLIHGSCVNKNGRAYLFTAQGGGGKTSTALNATRRGYSFMGDNYIIAYKGVALSYLSPLNIFHFNLNSIITENMSFQKRFEFQLKNYLRKLTGLSIATKIDPRSIMPGPWTDEAELKSILLLLPKETFQVSDIGREELIDKISYNMKIDLCYFQKYFLEYSYMFPKSFPATFWRKYTELLDQNIPDSIKTFQVAVPRKYNQDVFEKLLEVIEDDGYPEL